MDLAELLHLVGGPGAFPLGDLQTALEGTDGPATATTWEFTGSGDTRVVFTGSFVVEDSVAESGTATGFDVYVGTTKVLSGSGYALSVAQIIDAAEGAREQQPGDYMRFYSAFFRDVKEVGTGDTDYMYGSTHKGKFLGKGGDDFLYGGPGKEVMRGGSGDDWVEGRGKADRLFGNEGDDTFAFTFTQDYLAGVVHRIADFSVKHDMIFLDAGLFEALTPGPLPKAAFHVGGKAETADQHVLYKKGSGGLYYDEDGSGGAKKIQIAELDPGLKLKAHHFAVDFVA